MYYKLFSPNNINFQKHSQIFYYIILLFFYWYNSKDNIKERENMKDEEDNPNLNKTVKTRSITFRLESTIIEELQAEAEYRETSLNVLINQILRRYSNWERYENKMGMLPIPKVILSSLMDEIMRIGKEKGIEDIIAFRAAIIKELSLTAFTF